MPAQRLRSALRAHSGSLPLRVLRDPDRWFILGTLIATIPAFYLEMLTGERSLLAAAAYVLAALAMVLRIALRRVLMATRMRRWLVWTLIAGLLLAAVLPPSSTSSFALTLRLLTALLTLLHMMWLLQHLLARDSLPSLLGAAVLVLLLCGAGFWWIEPRTPTLADGLWLAFTTAATVGYGDVVPSTPASKVFAVFVVLLGFGILSLVTASIAAMWVESSEWRMEHDILRDLHAEIGQLRAELRATHDELQSLRRRLDQPP
ncbi:potassium channel family protein [Sphaerotilus montanus]|uniref:potassium channel family protein n=1 Tax=Sphaerotilus montanus TaxID=522889 RepID=UPI003FA2D723